MAISRILSTGFELDEFTTGLYGYEVQYASFSGSVRIGVDPTHPSRTGNHCLYVAWNQYAIFNWSGLITQLQLSFAVRRINWERETGDDPSLVMFGTSSNPNIASLNMNTSDELEAQTNGVSRDTYAHSLQSNRYTHFGIDLKIHNTTGWFYVYVDGVEVLNYSGQTDHAGPSINQFIVNGDITNTNNTWKNGSNSYWDDMYLNNSEGEGAAALPVDKRFIYVRANGNGNYSQWTGSDGDSVNNYLLVDDAGVPDGETTRVTDSTTSNKDSYTMENPSLAADTVIDAVIPTFVGKNAGGGDGSDMIKLFTRYSATDLLGATQNLPNSYELMQLRQTTKPGGGAWDATAVDGMEVGVEMQ